MKIAGFAPARQSGVSYVEVLIATLLIAISLVPMMDAMSGATASGGAHELSAVRHAHLLGKMEVVLAEPYSALEATIIATMPHASDIPSSYSDLPGTTNRRLVYLSFYDGDNADSDDDPFTGMEPDLIWVRTLIEDTQIAVETLVYR